jgi:hypothetical protein
LYQFTKRVTKLTLIIILGYITAINFIQNVVEYPFLKVKSIYIDEIIGDHQCEFRRNRSTNDQIFCIRQILEKNGNTMRQYISYL